MKGAKYSLYTALGVIIISVVVCVITVYSTISYFAAKNTIVEEMHSYSEASIVSLRKKIAPYIEAYAINEYETLVFHEMDHMGFCAIVVSDSLMGEILGLDAYVSGKIRDDDWNAIDYEPENKQQNIELERCFYSVTAKIISLSGSQIGTVTIYSSDRAVKQELKNTIIKNVIYSISISILLILLLFFSIRRVILRPVSEIVNGLIKSDEKGIPREKVVVRGSREIEVLATSINNLIDAIHTRERELMLSEDWIRLLLDSTAEGIYGVDLNGSCTFANKMCLKMLGYEHESELIGKEIHGIVHHSYSDGSPFPIERCSICGGVEKKEGKYVGDEVLWRSDGSTFSAEYFSFPIQKEGAIIGSIVTFLDITKRKQAESSMQAVVASTAEHIGKDFFNIAVESLYQWLNADVVILGELIGAGQVKAIAMMLDGEFIDGYSYELKGTPCENVFNTGICNYPENIITLFPKDKELQDLSIESYLGCPIKNKSGKVIGILCALSRKKNHFRSGIENVFKIIASRASVEMERELIEGQFHQSQKMEAVGTLVGGIAHDFNNMLAGMTGNLYLAKKEAIGLPNVAQRLEIVEKLAFSAAATIQQLLAFSRKGIMEMSPLSISPLLKETVKLQQVSLPENITFQLQIHDTDMLVKADVNLLQQVLMNLINNASDAVLGVKDPSITISLDYSGPLCQDSNASSLRW